MSTPPDPSDVVKPAEATGLQAGVEDAIVDFELVEPGKTVRIPQPKRRKKIVLREGWSG